MASHSTAAVAIDTDVKSSVFFSWLNSYHAWRRQRCDLAGLRGLSGSALRNNPRLQVYSLILILLALISLSLLPTGSTNSPLASGTDAVGFFNTPLNIVRLLKAILTGIIFVAVAVRTRGLLNKAIDETTRRKKLSQFLPAQLAEKLSTVEQAELLKGKLQPAAVLFVDLRGFTALSEGLAPGSLGAFLATYRQIVTAQIHHHHGIVDKFIGDSVMAVFGAPDATADDARNAIACGKAILGAIDQWNAERQGTGLSKVNVGIGIHSGEVFCGAVGDETRMEFTVLGDTVNVAARLEHATKQLGYPLVASEAVLTEAGIDAAGQNEWKPLGSREVRGRKEKLAIYGYP